ncbi:MAG: serine/threonine-protein kinase [Clostridiaceae bacterium]
MLNQGQILDKKYEVLKVLGQGGMGTVYLCKNNRLGNLWAVKEVNSQWKNNIDFLAEPNILKNLSHIGIIRIVDIFYENDNLYIVEDYVEGKTLKEQVDTNGPLPSKLVEDISLQLCSILDYLHSFNPPIIYRDLKPSNIMIKPGSQVVLIDFGIARTYKDTQEGDTMVLGSQGYIAPEQLVNAQSNAQTDIYSLGATMLFMLTGKAITQPLDLMLDKNYPGHADKRLIKVIQTATAADPKCRYSDIKQMMSEVNAIIADGEYSKTMVINPHESAADTTETLLAENKKPRKKTKIIMMSVLACILALAIFLALLMINKSSDKKASESSDVPKTAEPKVLPPKEVLEKDTIVRGILYMKEPDISSSDRDKRKGKGKDKSEDENSYAQYTLDPAASISNSKLSISLTNIQVIDHDVIVILSIQNTAAAALKLDLSKTYLVNDENKSTKCYIQNSISMISIQQSSNKQELKLYFKDLDFKGSFYTLKTVLSSAVNKDIILYIDVK